MNKIHRYRFCFVYISISASICSPSIASDNKPFIFYENSLPAQDLKFVSNKQFMLSQVDSVNERIRNRTSIRLPNEPKNSSNDTRETRKEIVEKIQKNTTSTTNRRSLPLANLKSIDKPKAAPSRWKIVDTLGYPSNILDPYSTNNPLKGDEPIVGEEWFFNLGIVSNTFAESRTVTTPLSNSTTRFNNQIDLIGDSQQTFFNQNFELEFVLYKGDTVFRPPDFEFRFIPVINYNRLELQEKGLINIDPTLGKNKGTVRTDNFIGIQTLFVDFHLRNVSSRYDFDSLRLGIQPFTTDFRGFLFQDQPLGIRLFGIRSNNIFQYNIAWFRRIEKDTNSGLNDIGQRLRDDDIYVANLYWQDLPTLGHTSQITLLYNRNREKNRLMFDNNGFIARPASFLSERRKAYDVTYLGYNGDGHFGRFNLTTSLYYALGKQTNAFIADKKNNISALFAALESSIDFDWIRTKFSALYASGDDDPFDDKDTGFDAVFENPQFAGADTSYYIRQSIPLIGGGGVALSGRNGILNSLRSSKEQGQSNFINPGLMLAGFGVDFDLLPELRVAFNANQLWFENTETLNVVRQQGSISKSIGTDLSITMTYRPLNSQNIVLRLAGATLVPGQGYKDLFGNNEKLYSIFANLILTY